MSIFEEIAHRHSQVEIQRICKKLNSSFSFSSGKHMELLCKLAYLLYILDDGEMVTQISQLTRKAVFPGKGYFRVWSFILQIWGLEAYLFTQADNRAAAQACIDEIQNIYEFPLPEIYSSAEQQRKCEQIRRGNLCYTDILHTKEIANAATTKRANDWRLIALYSMIGYTFTDLYPDLTLHKEMIQCAINEYVAELKKYLQVE